MKRGRPTSNDIEQRDQPSRLLSRIGEIDLKRTALPSQIIHIVGVLKKLIELYGQDSGGQKIIVYVRRVGHEEDQ